MKKLVKYLVLLVLIIFLLLVRYEKGYVYYGSEITLFTSDINNFEEIDFSMDTWRYMLNDESVIYIDKKKEIKLPGKKTITGNNQSYIPVELLYLDLNYYPFSTYATWEKGIEEMGLIIILRRYE